MTTKRTSVVLSSHNLKRIEIAHQELELSQSEIINRAIEHWFLTKFEEEKEQFQSLLNYEDQTNNKPDEKAA